MLRLYSRTGVVLLSILVFLALLALIDTVSAQSHNDKYYQILNVAKDASPRQIKKAYRKLSVDNHPDRAKDEEERKVMHEKMVELNKAFEVLSDPEKRQMYDAYGEEGPKQQMAHHHHANFDHLFNAFFGGAFHGGGHQQQQRQQRQPRQRQQQCVQTVTCRGNICQQTTVCH